MLTGIHTPSLHTMGGETEAFPAAILSFIFMFHKNKTEEGIWLPQVSLSLSSLTLSPLLFLQIFTLPPFTSLSHIIVSPPPSPPLHPSLLFALATSVNLISLIQDQCFPLSLL